jgi:hypothetical protein
MKAYTIAEQVSNMVALQKHVLEMVQKQSGEQRVRSHSETSSVINRIDYVLKEQIAQLERHHSSLGEAATSSAMKQAMSAVSGFVSGIQNRVRSEPVSRMLREDYAGLSMIAMDYTILHTTALALDDKQTAEIAQKNLGLITPLIVDISKLLPSVVVHEMSEGGTTEKPDVAQQALKNTQKAWDTKGTL